MLQEQIGAYHYTIGEHSTGGWAFYVQDLRNPKVRPEGLLIEEGLCDTLGEAAHAVELLMHRHLHQQLTAGVKSLQEFVASQFK